MKRIACLSLSFMLALPMAARAQSTEQERITASYNTLKEILGTPDKGIPQNLLDGAECVLVYPSVKKGAFIVGASYGRGVITCRTGANHNGPWSPPAMYALEGASFGFQVGGQETDFVLLIMNPQGAKSVMSSKVKLGGDASIAAGPVGRNASAETDAVMKAQILSWSRARGVFAGISLAGSTMRADNGANKELYGKELTATDIVYGGKVKAPAVAAPLLTLLTKRTPRHIVK
jgi:SH3 domain-containing YSC84-like protein 1